ncbi:MAG: DUF1223 domain-containing protein [Alphaproteobacteria bacterium]|nr:DUF1223 domain-containing protein [Alphaproteobacteria bacterium]
MTRVLAGALFASWLGLGAPALAQADAGASAPVARRDIHARPIVVELYTAQGCVTCDKAYPGFADLAARKGVIALTFPVDYWDYLGWKDTFADPAYTLRQKAYARRLGPRDVYTPQVVVDGLGQAPGDDGAAIDRLLARARRAERRGPRLTLRRDGRLHVGGGAPPAGGAEVLVLHVEATPAPVQVKAGDNRGATVAYHDVVRDMTRLGVWRGAARDFTLPKSPASTPGLATVILVQRARGGPVLAAREVPPRSPTKAS